MNRSLVITCLVLLSISSTQAGDDVLQKMPAVFERAGSQTKVIIELSTLAKDGKPYLDMAKRQLLALSSPEFLAQPGTNGGFILTRSTGHLTVNSEINVPLNYADYYFLEALLRYQALVEGKARVSLGAAK